MRINNNICRHSELKREVPEEKRIDNFLVQEITETVKALAADPSEQFPESLKLIIQRRLNEYKNNKKGLKDLK